MYSCTAARLRSGRASEAPAIGFGRSPASAFADATAPWLWPPWQARKSRVQLAGFACAPVAAHCLAWRRGSSASSRALPCRGMSLPAPPRYLTPLPTFQRRSVTRIRSWRGHAAPAGRHPRQRDPPRRVRRHRRRVQSPARSSPPPSPRTTLATAPLPAPAAAIATTSLAAAALAAAALAAAALAAALPSTTTFAGGCLSPLNLADYHPIRSRLLGVTLAVCAGFYMNLGFVTVL